jgi:hypothetical protein
MIRTDHRSRSAGAPPVTPHSLPFVALLIGIALAQLGSPLSAQEGPVRIDDENVEKYAELLPEPIAKRVKLGQYVLNLVPVDGERFKKNYTERFWQASAANEGKYGVDAKTGGLAEASSGKIPQQVYGLPFPKIDPNDAEAGVKIIHNYRLRKMQANGSSHEFDLDDVLLSGEVLRTVKILLSHKYYVGTSAPPPATLPDNTEMRQLGAALFPRDLEGIGVVTWRIHDWTTWDSVWMYMPTIRRVRRVRSSQRGDRIPGFEVQADDADCYDNKATYFRWKLAGSGEVIGPVGGDTPYAYPLEKQSPTRWSMTLPYNKAVFETPNAKGAGWWPLQNVFVRRPVWIVEGTPNDPYYDSGKIVLYIDRELFHGYYKISFTPAGELFRTNLCGQAWGRTADGEFAAPTALLMLGVNEKENRGTPAGRFTKDTFDSALSDELFTAKHLSKLSE